MKINLLNGRVFLGALQKINLQIDNGKIVRFGNNLSPAEKNIDVMGKIIFSGFIDAHVHFRDLEQSYKEDWDSGSAAAAAGGITTVLDMPNNQPPILSRQILQKKRRLAQTKSLVNFGFHFGSSEDNLAEIKEIDDVASVKVYLNETTGKLMINSPKILSQIFQLSKLTCVHAEAEMVCQAGELIGRTNHQLYYCHISTKEEMIYLQANKIKGKIFVEVTPHHLFLTKKNENSFVKMKPSLKTSLDQSALWKAITNGLVDTIGSDHAPHTREDKQSVSSPYGVPGVETMMPLLFNAHHQNKISLEKIVKLCSENPAKIFGLQYKGFIKKGYDADLSVVDLNLTKKVDEEKLFTKCGWSPFANWQLKGWPVMTIVGGNIVYNQGKIYTKVKGKEVIYESKP